MCGIFGITIGNQTHLTRNLLKKIIVQLFLLTESRGKEASGLALLADEEIRVVKHRVCARRLLMTKDFRKLIDCAPLQANKTIATPACIIGHTRLVTSGDQQEHNNNQPVIKCGMVVVHNGIIVNNESIWEQFPDLTREAKVDTEIVPALLNFYYTKGLSLIEGVRRMFRNIEGSASIAVLFEKMDYLLLATNTGSLFFAHRPGDDLSLFASEQYELKTVMRRFRRLHECTINHISPGEALLVHIPDCMIQPFSIFKDDMPIQEIKGVEKTRQITDIASAAAREAVKESFHINVFSQCEHLFEDNRRAISLLRRCKCCILPETFPFIVFDEKGVCNICRTNKKVEYKGSAALENLVVPFRKKRNEPDVLVCLSGGRDSSFMLHYFKTELNMNPVAYTYDWGMVTNLARRNIARITGKLGIEHILISADIRKKRDYIRQNIIAWLKRPLLGTVPLFMSGDKQMFYYARILQKRMSINLLFFGINQLERTDFKVSFCGFKERKKEKRHYHLSQVNKLRILAYYTREIALNPAYLNMSLLDSTFAFFCYYFLQHQYHLFYEYIPWDEKMIENTIIQQYNWETAQDTGTTWRVGDGTAAFYNYIYYTVAGFSENDTLRSNQIREGLITRDDALRLTEEENRSRPQSLRWYCDTVGVEFGTTIKRINAIPKLYRK